MVGYSSGPSVITWVHKSRDFFLAMVGKRQREKEKDRENRRERYKQSDRDRQRQRQAERDVMRGKRMKESNIASFF